MNMLGGKATLSAAAPALNPLRCSTNARRQISAKAKGRKQVGGGKKHKAAKRSQGKDKQSESEPAQGAQPARHTAQLNGQTSNALQTVAPPPASEVAAAAAADNVSFEDKLKELQASSAELAQEQKAKNEQASVLAQEGAYSNPPSIIDSMRKTQQDPDKVNPFGNGVLGFGAVLLVAVALIASAIGLGSDPSAPTTSGLPSVAEEASTTIREQLAGFEAKLAADASDAEALEGAAVSYVNLGDYAKAEGVLSKLVTLNSKDPQAWRLLGEVRGALGQKAPTVAAYREAYKIAEADIELLKGFTTALVNNARPGEAVRVVQNARETAQLAVQQRGPGGEAEGVRLNPIEVELLLGRVYSQWRGHTGDALAVYDQIIVDYPEDFRGFLAKGVLLRNEGRKGDADRAFLQARYLAPKSARAIVDRIAAP